MFVDNQTFNKIYNDSTSYVVGGGKVRIVSARHLVLLKIHALKYYQEHRYLKDFTDLVTLLKSDRVQLTQAELREFCEKYASKDLYDKLSSDLGTVLK